jgi:hypothetical protein
MSGLVGTSRPSRSARAMPLAMFPNHAASPADSAMRRIRRGPTVTYRPTKNAPQPPSRDSAPRRGSAHQRSGWAGGSALRAPLETVAGRAAGVVGASRLEERGGAMVPRYPVGPAVVGDAVLGVNQPAGGPLGHVVDTAGFAGNVVAADLGGIEVGAPGERAAVGGVGLAGAVPDPAARAVDVGIVTQAQLAPSCCRSP